MMEPAGVKDFSARPGEITAKSYRAPGLPPAKITPMLAIKPFFSYNVGQKFLTFR